MGLLPEWMNDPAVSGTFGSLVSLKWAPGKTWVARALAILGAVGVTLYATPAVAKFYRITDFEYIALIGFFFGACGPYILNKAVAYVRDVPWKKVVELFTPGSGAK